ncbi:hypothetical protein [Burkholderia pyrrocinia]|uniref:hypothetical protein n=1 Tax=Burkholderia pyrrocinia TaxID=60550 RepID=UPI00158F3FB4|nr:hypothetical protein [Burkholderia pyrrocinia]
MATRTTRVMSGIGTGLLIVLWVFLFLKHSITEPWQPPADFQIYMVAGDDGRNLLYDFTPDGDGILWYHNRSTKYTEGVLFRIHGRKGRHYFWRLWNIGDSPLGLRIYPDGMTPYVFDYTIRAKYVEGSETPSLPAKGDHISGSVVLIGPNAVSVEGMWLPRFDTQAALSIKTLDFTARLMGYFGEAALEDEPSSSPKK